MKRSRISMAVVIVVGAGSIAAFAGSAASMNDEYSELATGEETGGNVPTKPCYGLYSPWVQTGSCPSNKTCCGWVNCSDPSESSNKCCSAAQTCENGLHVRPPVPARCVTTP